AGRLARSAQIVDSTLAWRACLFNLASRDDDISSRTLLLSIAQEQSEAGVIAPMALADAQGQLAAASLEREAQWLRCAQWRHSLAALTGLDLADIPAGIPADIP